MKVNKHCPRRRRTEQRGEERGFPLRLCLFYLQGQRNSFVQYILTDVLSLSPLCLCCCPPLSVSPFLSILILVLSLHLINSDVDLVSLL